MKVRALSLLVVALLLLSQCKKNQKTQPDPFIVGKWQTSFVRLDYPSYRGSDSAHYFVDRFQKGTERFAQSEYFPDGTFKAWFVDKDGNKQDETTGTWSLHKDSLSTSYFYLGKQMSPVYRIKEYKNKKGFKATSIFDWDGDGESDDQIIMRTDKLD